MSYYLEMLYIVKEILKFSPYTHFYTQTLIDIIIKTYNSGVFRTDLLYKYKIPVFIGNSKYYQDERYAEIEEDEYIVQTCLFNWIEEIEEFKTELRKLSDKYYVVK